MIAYDAVGLEFNTFSQSPNIFTSKLLPYCKNRMAKSMGDAWNSRMLGDTETLLNDRTCRVLNITSCAPCNHTFVLLLQKQFLNNFRDADGF